MIKIKYNFLSIKLKSKKINEFGKYVMNIFKNLFLIKKQQHIQNKCLNYEAVDQYKEIAKLVKEARIQQNLSIEELSHISKIPEQTINSIENNNKNIRPKYPFIRSILIKLEDCLSLKKMH